MMQACSRLNRRREREGEKRREAERRERLRETYLVLEKLCRRREALAAAG